MAPSAEGEAQTFGIHGQRRKEWITVKLKQKMQLRFCLAMLPALAGLIVLFFTPWLAAGFVLVLLSAPAMFALLRCPYCGRYLGHCYTYGKYCPHFGEKLE